MVNNSHISRFIVLSVLTSASACALADHHTLGSNVVYPPALASNGSGYGIQGICSGEIYNDYSAYGERWKVSLTIDGTTVWTNSNPLVPLSWPGLVYDYEPNWPVSSGTHHVIWRGYCANPAFDDVTYSGWTFYYETDIVVP